MVFEHTQSFEKDTSCLFFVQVTNAVPKDSLSVVRRTCASRTSGDAMDGGTAKKMEVMKRAVVQVCCLYVFRTLCEIDWCRIRKTAEYAKLFF